MGRAQACREEVGGKPVWRVMWRPAALTLQTRSRAPLADTQEEKQVHKNTRYGIL
jgi:hypothetical protein